MLRSVYFGIVYSHLQYGITSWGKAAAKYTDRIRVQQNYIGKIMTSSSFLKVKLSPIYQHLNFLNLNSIYHLEVLKFVYKFRSKTLPRAFHNYFSLSSETHRNISTRFSTGNNLIVLYSKNLPHSDLFNMKGVKFGITYLLKLKIMIASVTKHSYIT